MKTKKAFIILLLIGLNIIVGVYDVYIHLAKMPYPTSRYEGVIKYLLDNGYKIILPREYTNQTKVAFLVHDVDFDTNGIMAFLNAESKYKVKSAYYIRPDADYFEQSIRTFQDLEKIGFEVGYHYDVLSRTNNTELAIKLFISQVQYLRNFFDIKTTRPHGDNYNFNIFNGEIIKHLPYGLSILDFTMLKGFSQIISDTNHIWYHSDKLTDRVYVLLHTDYW